MHYKFEYIRCPSLRLLVIVTWQKSTRYAAKEQAIKTARISRLEGMEGHARSADVRLKKFFPDQNL